MLRALILDFGFDVLKIDRKNVEKAVAKLNNSGWEEWTKHDYKAIIKKYIK